MLKLLFIVILLIRNINFSTEKDKQIISLVRKKTQKVQVFLIMFLKI